MKTATSETWDNGDSIQGKWQRCQVMRSIEEMWDERDGREG